MVPGIAAAVLALTALLPASVFALTRNGSEFAVNEYTTNNQADPAVAGLADGGFVVVWESYGQDGSRNSVYGRTFSDSDDPDQDLDFQVTGVTARDQQHPDVAALTDGNFVVVWESEDQDGSGSGVFGQIFDPTGDPQLVSPDGDDDDDDPDRDDFQVNTYTPGDQAYPQVAPVPSGFVVVWVSSKQDGSERGVFAQRFDLDGNRKGSEFLVNTYTTGAQRTPVVTGDAQGRFTVLWTSEGQDGSNGGIFAQRYAATGAPSGGEFQVNTITTQDQVRPQAVPWGEGGFLASWESRFLEQKAEKTDGIAAREANADGSMPAPEYQVNGYTTGFQEDVAIASFGAAEIMVVWEANAGDSGPVSPEDTNNGVFARSMAPNGTVTGEDFQVNTYTTNAQQDPSVAAMTDGRYIVAWESDGQDGSAGGIFAQLYDASVCGDADDSGGLTATDALRILQFALGTGICTKCVCDSDGNGAVTASDALLVLNAVTGGFSKLGCQSC